MRLVRWRGAVAGRRDDGEGEALELLPEPAQARPGAHGGERGQRAVECLVARATLALTARGQLLQYHIDFNETISRASKKNPI